MGFRTGDLVVTRTKDFIGRLSYVGNKQTSIDSPAFRFVEIKLIRKPDDWHPDILACNTNQIIKIGKKHEHKILSKL